MTTYKVFYKLIKSHIKSIALYFIIFAALTMVLLSPSTNEQNIFDQEKISMTIIDRDHSTLSKAITAYMDSSQNLVELKDDKEVWTDEMFIRNTEYILIIPENFESDTLAGKSNLLSNYKLPGSTSGSFIDMEVDEYLKTFLAFVNSGESLDEALESTEHVFSISSEVTLTDNPHNSLEEQPSYYYFFKYLPYIFICMVINGLGPVLMTFREEILKNRINCSSYPIMSRNIKLVLSSITFSLFLWVLFMVLGVTQYHAHVMTKGYLLLSLNSLLFIVLVLAMTYLIIHFVKNENVLNMVSNIFGLGSSFLCGIFVPKELLGDGVLFAGQFLPPYWYLDAMDNIFADNMQGFAVDMLILLGFTMAFLAIALAVSKQTAKAKA